MIYYFSGTGNSKWIAEQLAIRLNDAAVPISGDHIQPEEHPSRIGFVFPIYAWGVSEPMFSFIRDFPKQSCFTFAVCTCGADAGKAMKSLCKEYSLNSCYSIRMPNNYIIGEDLESEEDIQKKFEEAVIRADQIAAEITAETNSYQVHEGKWALLKTKVIHPLFNRYARNTKPFHADAALCDGCGWCAVHCPAKTIQLVDGLPVWNQSCYQCLKCLNGCPKKAINYGKHTMNRKRYRMERYVKSSAK